MCWLHAWKIFFSLSCGKGVDVQTNTLINYYLCCYTILACTCIILSWILKCEEHSYFLHPIITTSITILYLIITFFGMFSFMLSHRTLFLSFYLSISTKSDVIRSNYFKFSWDSELKTVWSNPNHRWTFQQPKHFVLD